jgi:GxxExxY protein
MTRRDGLDLSATILEAARAVHAGLPPGLGAVAYREALGIELTRRRVPISAGVEVPIHYKGIRLTAHYRVDFICVGALLVLVRTAGGGGGELSWVPGCLEASGAIRAVVLGFGGQSLQWAQVVRSARPRLVAEALT